MHARFFVKLHLLNQKRQPHQFIPTLNIYSILLNFSPKLHRDTPAVIRDWTVISYDGWKLCLCFQLRSNKSWRQFKLLSCAKANFLKYETLFWQQPQITSFNWKKVVLSQVANYWHHYGSFPWIHDVCLALHEKCPYSELFWSAFFHIRTEYGEILRISPCSVRIRENADKNTSENGHFLCSVAFNKEFNRFIFINSLTSLLICLIAF